METKNKFYKDEMPHIVASSQVYGEVRSDSTAPTGSNEASEVTTAMRDLVSVISRLRESFDQIELALRPVLPQDHFGRDVPAPIDGSSKYSCSLAAYIESEFKRVDDLECRAHNILTNIKL
jgi:hypothetical protein